MVAIQIAEALKIITGQIDKLHHSLIQFDLWRNTYTKVNLAAMRGGNDCPTCQQRKYDFLNATRGQMTTSLCGRNAVQITNADVIKLELKELADRLRGSGEVSLNKYLLRFEVGEFEMTIFSDARTIIKGTNDVSLARSLYAKYVGA